MSAKIHISENSLTLDTLKTTDLVDTASGSVGSDCKLFATESAFSRLPFIHTQNHGFNPVSNWHVPPAEDYSHACDAGREYANHFARYLRDNPDMCGANLLGVIARDIDFEDTSNTAGYWVGFFSHLERLICVRV